MLWPHVGGAAIIWTWDAALWLSAALAFALLRRLRPGFRFDPRPGMRPFLRNRRLMLAYQLSWLGGWLPVFAFPILVVAELGLRDNAHFYFTWSIGAVFFMVSTSVSAALFAEGSNRANVHHQARLALKVTGAILLPMAVVTLLFAHQILLIFGPEYADHGAGLLRICALGALPDAVTNLPELIRAGRGELPDGRSVAREGMGRDVEAGQFPFMLQHLREVPLRHVGEGRPCVDRRLRGVVPA